jgi:repressor LexA
VANINSPKGLDQHLLLLDEISDYRRADIVEFITNFTAEHGYSPSFREIAAGCGYTSTSSVSHQLSQMREMGQVEYMDNIARSVRVVA